VKPETHNDLWTAGALACEILVLHSSRWKNGGRTALQGREKGVLENALQRWWHILRAFGFAYDFARSAASPGS
jgi:hypothetical protein